MIYLPTYMQVARYLPTYYQPRSTHGIFTGPNKKISIVRLPT